jgi:acyl-lipid omega-6 desaturase (Delta-12 desaturase)
MSTSLPGAHPASAAAPAPRPLRSMLAEYQAPVLRRSLGQLATTFIPFFAIIAAMYMLRTISPWITLALTIPAGGLIVRIFIIQHDCGHGAFFRSRAANTWVGRFCSLVTMTPFANWRRQHANHHAVWNNLDRRETGTDIYSTCLTVAEYKALSPFGRWRSRAARHPLVSHLLLPPLVFLLVYRVPFDTPAAWKREKISVYLTNLGLAVLFTALVLLLGAGPVALVQIPSVAIAAIIGVWLFSVQHRFENAVWSRQPTWNSTDAALLGSSHLELPRILQWFSGNIGFHHIHHLLPGVPNYRLADCHRACAALVPSSLSLTLLQAIRAPSFALWDEERACMVRFSDVTA